MHEDDAALVSHLFAVAMGKLEDGTVVTSRGQGFKLSRAVVAREARQLKAVAQDAAAIADAILAITHRVDTTLTPQSKRKR